MTQDPDRFSRAIEHVDAANADDPRQVVVDGRSVPAGLHYGRLMTRWLDRLYPDAPEPLRLAARCQHVRRWLIPRDSFPMDRAGYHRWRTTLYSFHADQAEAILRDVDYDDATVARVRSLLKKERLKADPDAQALEDTICLVFLENEFPAFAAKHPDEKVVHILRRTWAKMSAHGHDAALKLDYPPSLLPLVQAAVA